MFSELIKKIFKKEQEDNFQTLMDCNIEKEFLYDYSNEEKLEKYSGNKYFFGNEKKDMTSDSAILIKTRIKAGETMCLSFRGKNLYNNNFINAYLKVNDENLYDEGNDRYRTTHWFEVDSSRKFIYMIGDAFNKAIWQFKDANDKLINISSQWENNKYKRKDLPLINKACAKTFIPLEAVKARIYFADIKDENTAKTGEVLQIAYGLIPENCQEYYERNIEINSENSGDLIKVYPDKWQVISNEEVVARGECHLDFDKIYSFQIDSKNDFKVEIESEEKFVDSEDKEYGIRWPIEAEIPVCERVGDAKNLHFNYKIENTHAGLFENDFDNIYPWSEMKTCALKVDAEGNEEIIYEGQEGFSRDGSVGEVMVEIPLFYSKREQKDGYEYLWITKKKKEGYKVEPSFITRKGILKKIYIGAYLASTDKKLHSASDTFVCVNENVKSLRKKIRKTDGFDGYDLLAHMTMEKLFLIETGILSSQSVFEGICNLPYIENEIYPSCIAIEKAKNSNSIKVKNTLVTGRIMPGDTVAVLENPEDIKNNKYSPRTVTDIKKIDSNKLEIYFDGQAINITKKKSFILCLPTKNGVTDKLNYHTGKTDKNNKYALGHEAFKYRGIENLWGNAKVYLENAYVVNDKLHICFPNGHEETSAFKLLRQEKTISHRDFDACNEITIKKMIYSKKHPRILFPEATGDGAVSSNYYGDAYYNATEKNKGYIISYGGALDSLGSAGIFNFSIDSTIEDKSPSATMRLIYRKNIFYKG
ncbi:hypothetical protein SAMN05216249_10313 [Acetitomaculum ruminis DSM 5522]|uniref:Uncharacterized protein n=1 Tax=Acetitomaculum ruminis DSM 5522 TaxID=1120918 RepID=A0A1I0W1L3_9FIRM|nr:hypothetical protein [Acetitomaculum ruminis]SFA82308.1 hypothetical protein SAMN05216249_10313 [Acetitomaculum ruminis DSM 5522]